MRNIVVFTLDECNGKQGNTLNFFVQKENKNTCL